MELESINNLVKIRHTNSYHGTIAPYQSGIDWYFALFWSFFLSGSQKRGGITHYSLHEYMTSKGSQLKYPTHNVDWFVWQMRNLSHTHAWNGPGISAQLRKTTTQLQPAGRAHRGRGRKDPGSLLCSGPQNFSIFYLWVMLFPVKRRNKRTNSGSIESSHGMLLIQDLGPRVLRLPRVRRIHN